PVLKVYQTRASMSALDHEQTSRSAIAMSALPPKADMCSAVAHVRFGPIADIRGGVTAYLHRACARCEVADYFGAFGPTNFRPLGTVPLTWISVGSRIST